MYICMQKVYFILTSFLIYCRDLTNLFGYCMYVWMDGWMDGWISPSQKMFKMQIKRTETLETT